MHHCTPGPFSLFGSKQVIVRKRVKSCTTMKRYSYTRGLRKRLLPIDVMFREEDCDSCTSAVGRKMNDTL